MSEAATQSIPRWAREFAPETWARMNELLMEGATAHETAEKCGIPEDKRRSLRAYAAQFGPRRRLRAFERFKDALAFGGSRASAKLMEAMERIAALAVSPETPQHIQVRAFEAMNRMADQLGKVARDDAEAEKARAAAEQRATTTIDPAVVVEEILKVYGVKR